MIDVNSNCSRVDAVKALANQLQTQFAPPPSPTGTDSQTRKIKSDFQALDADVKADDAKKAEAALAVTRKDIATAQTERNPDAKNEPAAVSSPFRGLDVYA
jgi:hypothetical protein